MTFRAALALSLLAVPAVQTPATPTPAARTVASPAQLYGALYDAVERTHVFPDSKTFADAVPRVAPATILAAYRSEQPRDRAALAAFVGRYFTLPGGPTAQSPTLHQHIKALWPVLARAPLAVMPGGSALALPQAYVVPGGRYQEFYYWDTYFTMLGLKADGEPALVEAMLANFVSLIERYGHVPNGTRSYYLSRSQPPFLALMMDLSTSRDPALARARLAALKAEHAYWMAGAACLGADGACAHVVRMPDGSLLNRYWDASATPRDESYVEDVDTAAAASRPAAAVWRDLRAGAESGWDFGSRWLGDGRTLATIRTTDIVPIDLNSLMWNLEQAIARRCGEAGDAACARHFAVQAAARRKAIDAYLWLASDRRFADWDRMTQRATPAISAALLYPLFVGLATPAQARATATLTQERLLAEGGLRTTIARTGQQWDEPNGWAPLQWIAIAGLDRYGDKALADTIATRWMTTVDGFYRRTGRIIEKYDVESRGEGGGGEYVVQDGFGWTNGVASALIARSGTEPPR